MVSLFARFGRIPQQGAKAVLWYDVHVITPEVTFFERGYGHSDHGVQFKKRKLSANPAFLASFSPCGLLGSFISLSAVSYCLPPTFITDLFSSAYRRLPSVDLW